MIQIHIKSFPDREWGAVAIVQGKEFRIRAPAGAGNRLAKIMLREGVPDQPVAIINPTGNEALQTTLKEWASFDYREAMGKYLAAQNLPPVQSWPATPAISRNNPPNQQK